LQKGGIVLCEVNGDEYLHLIKAIREPRFQIGYNRGRIGEIRFSANSSKSKINKGLK
jgi:hypothetical protein